jgi:hypothetical protein
MQSLAITSQAVGAYGEKTVEAELLRRGWITSNINISIKDAANFDLFALKHQQPVQIRVKTCGPNSSAFQFRLRPTQNDLPNDKFGKSDFTILVRMGTTRDQDEFYILRTEMVRQTIAKYRSEYLATPKVTGDARKDTGHWALHLPGAKERANRGFAEKWAKYRNNWALLEGKQRSAKTKQK